MKQSKQEQIEKMGQAIVQAEENGDYQRAEELTVELREIQNQPDEESKKVAHIVVEGASSDEIAALQSALNNVGLEDTYQVTVTNQSDSLLRNVHRGMEKFQELDDKQELWEMFGGPAVDKIEDVANEFANETGLTFEEAAGYLYSVAIDRNA